MRRKIAATALAGVAALLAATPALAFHCSVVNKPAGAGSAGTVTLDVTTENVVSSNLNTNPAGHIRGAFASVTAVAGVGGPVVGTSDVFWHKDLPDGAHNSGPGNSECDGVGIDDVAACGP